MYFPFTHCVLSFNLQMCFSIEAITNMIMAKLFTALLLQILDILKNELVLTTPHDVKEKELFSFLRAGHGCLKAFLY